MRVCDNGLHAAPCSVCPRADRLPDCARSVRATAGSAPAFGSFLSPRPRLPELCASLHNSGAGLAIAGGRVVEYRLAPTGRSEKAPAQAAAGRGGPGGGKAPGRNLENRILDEEERRKTTSEKIPFHGFMQKCSY